VASAITIPSLPCADLDDSISFYEALGFTRTYRQQRPNPYAVVELREIRIHLFGLEDFDPETSYGSVIIAVSDPDTLYEDFASRQRSVRKASLIRHLSDPQTENETRDGAGIQRGRSRRELAAGVEAW